MAARTLFLVAIRVLAIGLLAFSIPAFVTSGITIAYFVFYEEGPNTLTFPGTFVPMLISLIPGLARGCMGLLLLFLAPRMGSFFYSQEKEDANVPIAFGPLGAGDLYRILSYLLGIYILLLAVKPGVIAFAGLVRLQQGRSQFQLETIASFVQAPVYLFSSLVLIFGAKRIAQVLSTSPHDTDTAHLHQFSLRLLVAAMVVFAVLFALIRFLALSSI